jgi:hypothetical protein
MNLAWIFSLNKEDDMDASQGPGYKYWEQVIPPEIKMEILQNIDLQDLDSLMELGTTNKDMKDLVEGGLTPIYIREYEKLYPELLEEVVEESQTWPEEKQKSPAKNIFILKALIKKIDKKLEDEAVPDDLRLIKKDGNKQSLKLSSPDVIGKIETYRRNKAMVDFCDALHAFGILEFNVEPKWSSEEERLNEQSFSFDFYKDRAKAWREAFDNNGAVKDVKTIELEEVILNALPPEIERFENLEVLKIAATGLSSVPKELGNLPNLKVLDLSGNDLQSIPGELRNLPSLTFLDLRDNSELKEIPTELEELGIVVHLSVEIDKK